MAIRRFKLNIALSLAFLSFTLIAWGNQGIGKALSEAMQKRATGTVEEVIQQFQKAVEQTTNPAQKASVLSVLAEFLMEKQEWGKAIEVYERILTEGTDGDKPGAYYGSAQAWLMLNQPEKAKAICAELKANYPENTMEGFANYMKEISPESVHAKLAVFFAESPSGGSAKTSMGAAPAQPKPNEIAPEVKTSEDKPMATLPVNETQETTQPQPATEENKENRLAVVVKGWNSDLAGHIDAMGMSLGLNNETDIGAQTRLTINGNWKFSGKDQLRLEYSQFDHSGILNRAVTFDKLLYGPGAAVQLKTNFFDVGLSRLLDESKHASWKLLYGAKFNRSFTRLTQQMPLGTRAGELNQTFSVPYLGLEGIAKLSGNVTLNGSVKSFSLNRSGSSGRLTDLDLAFLFGRDYSRVPAQTEWYGSLGYRYFLFHGAADNDSTELRYFGPTFGLESRF